MGGGRLSHFAASMQRHFTFSPYKRDLFTFLGSQCGYSRASLAYSLCVPPSPDCRELPLLSPLQKTNIL